MENKFIHPVDYLYKEFKKNKNMTQEENNPKTIMEKALAWWDNFSQSEKNIVVYEVYKEYQQAIKNGCPMGDKECGNKGGVRGCNC